MKIKKIYLYDEPSVKEIQIKNLAKRLEKKFNISVEVKENILKNADEKIAKKIASCRVFNPKLPFVKHIPVKEEIDFELENFHDSSRMENIIMYDGFEFQNIITDIIPYKLSGIETFHIVFTNRLMCTFDNSDYRYHGRALIGTNPTIISTTGVIEAPAKPKEYYFELISNFATGLNVDSLKKKYSGTYLEYHDQRLPKIMEGYAMQAIFYYITGEPFCEDTECILFNAHWQKDLLHSQIDIGKLCSRHQDVMNSL